MRTICRVLSLAGLALAQLGSAQSTTAADWPQWRGPDRSNRSSETGLLQSWPTNGPPLLWKATGLGEGIASVSVAKGQLYTLGYRDGGEFVFVLDAQTGESKWSSRVGSAVKENTLMRWLTQRTPTVDEDRLYTMTARGDLICLRTSDGQKLWQKSYPNDFASPRPTWGFGDRPLVDGDKLICAPAGTNASVVALNKRTGEVLWKSNLPSPARESYAATVVSEAGGLRHYVAFLGGGLTGIEAKEGRFLWRYAGTASGTGNSYTPTVQGDFVFSANGYARGMALLKLVREGNGIIAQEQYRHRFNFNALQDATVFVGDHVYAFQSAALPVCIEMKSGVLAWGPVTNAIKGRAALTCADNHLYLRGANGLMLLVEANPKSYVEKGSFFIPGREEASGVTSPVVAGGRLYLRDNTRLLCYDINADALTKPSRDPKTTVVSLTAAQTRAEEETVAAPLRTGKDRAPDAIFVSTPDDVVEKMLELAAVKEKDVVYDLGSGDGRIVIFAARKYGSKTVGYEIDQRLVALARENVRKSNLEQLVRIEHADMFTVELSDADVIAVFLPSPLLQRLLPQFEKLKPGTRIVSHQFDMPGLPPQKTITVESKEDGEPHRLFLWTAPLPAAKTAPKASSR